MSGIKKDTVMAISEFDYRVLETLVPVNALTLDHLNTLMRHRDVEVICKGQTIFEIGESDNHHIYLLSGEIHLQGEDGQQRVLCATDPCCRFPIAPGHPRRAVAIATADSHIIRFDRDELDGMLAWDQVSRYIMLDIAARRDLDEDADWMLTLLKSNLFYKVPPINIRKIIDKFEAVYFSAGETIIRQGELGHCCYFIKEGAVSVWQSESSSSPSVKVNELHVGRCFGEDALVNHEPRNATLIMESNGVLMRLNKIDFYQLLKSPILDTIELNDCQRLMAEGSIAIDVRTQDEYEYGHCEGAINMPLDLLKLKSRMLDPSQHYIIYCNSGRRSEAAAYLLAEEGFRVSTLKRGFTAYPREQILHCKNGEAAAVMTIHA